MGILNVTPDSFSDGGVYLRPEAARRHAQQMVEDGAAIIDVGGESSRPGAAPVTADEEARRVLPVIRAIRRRLSVPISIDTWKAEVAARALEAGASVVNDITALRGDARMAQVVAKARAGVVLMHMQGTPRTMQRHPRYGDVVEDVAQFLAEAIARARRAGISKERLWIDPGIGFGKTVAHNLLLLHNLERFARLSVPVVVGPSRKSFIGAILGAEVRERLAGTLACVASAASAGVDGVRVHDVKPAAQLLAMWTAIDQASRSSTMRRKDSARCVSG